MLVPGGDEQVVAVDFAPVFFSMRVWVREREGGNLRERVGFFFGRDAARSQTPSQNLALSHQSNDLGRCLATGAAWL